jgi:protein SCO1/2
MTHSDVSPTATPAAPEKPRQGYLVVFIVILAACAATWLKFTYTPKPAVRILPDLGPAPAFRLSERSGAIVGSDELKGNLWIADFIFTRCAGSCPLMSTQMRDLQESFGRSEHVVLVSFSVDPANDTQEALNAYANRYMAKPGRWLFLRGGEGEVAKLAMSGFKLASGTDGGAGDPTLGASEPAIIHSQRFVLVDGAGRIRGYFDGTSGEVVQQVVSAVRAILQEEKTRGMKQ